MLKNKKGAVSETITDMVAYLFFILIMVLFFFLFKFGSTDLTVKISGEVGEANANNIFLGYLNYPVKVDLSKIKAGEGEQEMTMADLIGIYYSNKDVKKGDFQKIIGDATEDYFKNYKNLQWMLSVSDISSDSSEFRVREGQTKYIADEGSIIETVQSACATIPAINGEMVKVELLFANLKAIREIKLGNAFTRSEYSSKRDNHKFDC